MSKTVPRKHVRRRLRKCGNFRRGKCTECDETTAERNECTVREHSRKTD